MMTQEEKQKIICLHNIRQSSANYRQAVLDMLYALGYEPVIDLYTGKLEDIIEAQR